MLPTLKKWSRIGCYVNLAFTTLRLNTLLDSDYIMASSKAATQKSASKVLDSRQDKTARLCQSMIATRYRKPRRIRIYVMSAHHT